MVQKGVKIKKKTFIKLFSIYFDGTKWVFSCMKRTLKKLLFQGVEMCLTFFCCYVTVLMKAD